MVISAGLVPILLQLLINKRVSQLKVYEHTIISSAYRTNMHPSNLYPKICDVNFLERDKDHYSLGQPHLWIQHCIHVVLRL